MCTVQHLHFPAASASACFPCLPRSHVTSLPHSLTSHSLCLIHVCCTWSCCSHHVANLNPLFFILRRRGRDPVLGKLHSVLSCRLPSASFFCMEVFWWSIGEDKSMHVIIGGKNTLPKFFGLSLGFWEFGVGLSFGLISLSEVVPGKSRSACDAVASILGSAKKRKRQDGSHDQKMKFQRNLQEFMTRMCEIVALLPFWYLKSHLAPPRKFMEA